MTPELRARLLEWLPASMVDAPEAYPPGYDGPLDERTPGLVRLPGRSLAYYSPRIPSMAERLWLRDNMWALEILYDRERLIDDVRD